MYSVADVCRLVGWTGVTNRQYQRVHSAIGTGHAGVVGRCGRGFVLSEDNVRQLVPWLKERWAESDEREPVAAK
jgi:hypothetical protein